MTRPTRAEEERLFRAYWETGSVAARDRIVERYSYIADHHATRFRRPGVEADDLRQVGMLAILRLVSRFDASKGASFATFADRTVEGECKRYLRDRTWLVRPPRRLHDAHLRVRRVADELTCRLSRSPTIAELAEDLGWEEEDVLEALEVAECRHGADPDAEADGRRAWFEPAIEDSGLEHSTDRLWLQRALERVDPETRELLMLRYFGGRSQADLASRYGVSQSYMSRMLRMGIERLREAGGLETAEVG